MPSPPRSRQRIIGHRIDPGRLQYELTRRGLSLRELAERSGIPPETLSRAKHGRSLSLGNLHKLAAGLAAAPVLEVVDLLLSEPQKGAA